MCGILGLILGHIGDNPDAPCQTAIDLHEALYFLQHRGQDAWYVMLNTSRSANTGHCLKQQD